jgi:hypothetical protein
VQITFQATSPTTGFQQKWPLEEGEIGATTNAYVALPIRSASIAYGLGMRLLQQEDPLETARKSKTNLKYPIFSGLWSD